MWSYALIWLKNYLFNSEENKSSFSSKTDWKLIALIVFSLFMTVLCLNLIQQNKLLIEEKQNISNKALDMKNEIDDLKKTIKNLEEDQKLTNALILKDCEEKKQNKDLKQKSLDKVNKIKLATHKKTNENKNETKVVKEINTSTNTDQTIAVESSSRQLYKVLLEDFCFDNNTDVCEAI